MPVVLCVGYINVDFRATVTRWPQPGESLPARNIAAASGGRAANVATMARRLGVASALLGRVGDDRYAAIALEPLQKAGVDVRHVSHVAGAATGAGLDTSGAYRVVAPTVEPVDKTGASHVEDRHVQRQRRQRPAAAAPRVARRNESRCRLPAGDQDR